MDCICIIIIINWRMSKSSLVPACFYYAAFDELNLQARGCGESKQIPNIASDKSPMRLLQTSITRHKCKSHRWFGVTRRTVHVGPYRPLKSPKWVSRCVRTTGAWFASKKGKCGARRKHKWTVANNKTYRSGLIVWNHHFYFPTVKAELVLGGRWLKGNLSLQHYTNQKRSSSNTGIVSKWRSCVVIGYNNEFLNTVLSTFHCAKVVFRS